MSNQPIWITPAGTLGTLPVNTFYSVQLEADEPITLSTVYFKIVSGSLPGGMICSDTGLISGTPMRSDGFPYTSRFTIRAYTTRVVNGKVVEDRVSDRTFDFVVAGDVPPQWLTGSGIIDSYYTGQFIHPDNYGDVWENPSDQNWGMQIEYTQFDECTVRFVEGELPYDCKINEKGFITGFLLPRASDPTYHEYWFTLELSNGRYSSLRKFAIAVYNLANLRADTTAITADNVYTLINGGNTVAPYVVTHPQDLPKTEPGDYINFKFDGFDVQGLPYQFSIQPTADFGWDMTLWDEDGYGWDGGVTTDMDGLTLDPNTGWLYGKLPPTTKPRKYTIAVHAFRKDDPSVVGPTSYYTLDVVRERPPEIFWTDAAGNEIPNDDSTIFLGDIDNGDVSHFFVSAGSPLLKPDQVVRYRLVPGVATSLPQGLTFSDTGLVMGRVAFQEFCFDSGMTTFDYTPSFAGINQFNDPQPTTFELDHEFTVEAYTEDGVISIKRKFKIKVNRKYSEPYETLYLKAMPMPESRCLLASLLENREIFPDERVYRPEDPNFGVARDVFYDHCFGLHPRHTADYVSVLRLNHYRKRMVLDHLKIAYGTDENGTVLYEVIYTDIVDDQENFDMQCVSKKITLPYWVEGNGFSLESEYLAPANPVIHLYPDGFNDMRQQVVDEIGQVDRVLPLWMKCNQKDGRKLGFQRAWVIAYAKPGQGDRIIFDIKNYFGNDANIVDFEVDRYSIDKQFTKLWDSHTNTWPRATTTTFDLYAWDTTMRYLRTVDYATTQPYCNMQGQTINQINSIGGFDGVITEDWEGRLIIFQKQEGWAGLTDTQAWTDTTKSTVVPPIERMWIYQIWINTDNTVWFVPLYATTVNDYVIVRTGATYNNIPVYYPPAPGAGQTVAAWTTLPIPSGDQTTFDENTLNFVDPVDTYEGVTYEYDEYVFFPKVNVLY